MNQTYKGGFMSRIIRIFLIIAIFSSFGFFSSCGDDNSSDPQVKDYFKANISGELTINFNAILIDYLDNEGVLSLVGYNGNSKQNDFITLQLDNISEGSQTIILKGIEGNHRAMFTQFKPALPSVYSDIEGEIKITVNNKTRISGTFSFKAEYQDKLVDIKNGEFSINKK